MSTRKFYEGDEVILWDGRDGRVFQANIGHEEDLETIIKCYGYGAMNSPRIGDVGVIVQHVSENDITARQANRDKTAWVVFIDAERLMLHRPSIHHELEGKEPLQLGELARRLAADLIRVTERLESLGFKPQGSEGDVNLKRALNGVTFKKTTITTV